MGLAEPTVNKEINMDNNIRLTAIDFLNNKTEDFEIHS